MTEQQIDPGHHSTRSAVRTLGAVLVVVGLLFTAIGLVSFLSAFGSFGSPRYFWCAIIGLPMFGVGMTLLKFGYMGRIARYMAQEAAPVGKDTFNYMADGTREGVKTVAGAIGQGLREGGFGGESGAMVRCHKCSGLVAADAKFCSRCGQVVGKTKACPECRELNDPDARFCDNCGYKYP